MVDTLNLPTCNENQIFVLDYDTAWITSLLNELPNTWVAHRIGTRSAGLNPSSWWRAFSEGIVGIPGWTRAFRLSTAILARAVRRAINKQGRPRAIVHTMPWTAGLLQKFPNENHVYRPQDYFGIYEWNQDRVLTLETELMNQSRVAIPMSPEHGGDLRLLGPVPIQVLPNGVSTEFVNRLRLPHIDRPKDMPPAGQFVIGCIGQINYYYNWGMIGELAKLLPDIVFVFIGPIIEPFAVHRRHIEEVLRQPNIRWLGAKPHRDLPSYLYHFDACLSPLLVTPANDRRSLLRLFDYLASDKPVISTAVAAARSHGKHVLLGDSAHELTTHVADIRAGRYHVDIPSRRAYVDQQTWAKRGIGLTVYVDRFCQPAAIRPQ